MYIIVILYEYIPDSERVSPVCKLNRHVMYIFTYAPCMNVHDQRQNFSAYMLIKKNTTPPSLAIDAQASDEK